jgi:hypothetical protein
MGKLPRPEMATGEHRFTLDEFRKMWLIADMEGKARLSVAVSLGWSISDFLGLTTNFVQQTIRNRDAEGFVTFDYRRMKTKARIRGILHPNAVHDLEHYLKKVPSDQEYLWTTRTKTGINYWLRRLFNEAGIQENGTIRFHLIRKYVFDRVSSQCGPYEAKLLTGKKIDISDETYLHGLEDRLLERYKKFAYPFLRLTGVRQNQQSKIEGLTEKVESLSLEVETWKEEAITMKKKMNEITKARRKTDQIMNQLIENPEFMAFLRKTLKEMNN